MGKERKYVAEFKREVLAQANDPGVTRAQIARKLGMTWDAGARN